MIVTLPKWASVCLYLAVFSLSAYLANYSKDKRRVRIFLISLPPVLLGGFRYYVGSDYGGYLAQFNNIEASGKTIFSYLKTYDFIDNPIGFFLTQKFASLFRSHIVYFIITSALNYVPVVIYLIRDWDNCKRGINILSCGLFTYLFCFYPFGLAAVRQGIAMSFCFYSLSYIYERKPIKFIILILIASTFHSTALIFMPIYFFWNEDNMIKKWKRYLIIGVAFLLIYEIDFIIERIGGRYIGYLNSEVAGTNATFWIMLFWCILFLVFRNTLISMDKRNDLLILLFIIGTIFQLLGFTNAFSKRIGEYFLITQTLLLPHLTGIFSSNSRKLGWYLIALYQLLVFIFQFAILGQSQIVPYSFMI